MNLSLTPITSVTNNKIRSVSTIIPPEDEYVDNSRIQKKRNMSAAANNKLILNEINK